jgi:hypothetical protein
MDLENSLPCIPNPPLATLLRKMNPFQVITTYLFKVQFYIIFPSTSVSQKLCLSSIFSGLYVVLISSLYYACYVAHPTYSSWFLHHHNIPRRRIIVRLHLMQFISNFMLLAAFRTKCITLPSVLSHCQSGYCCSCALPRRVYISLCLTTY